MDLGCILTLCFDICLHLSAPLVLVIFCKRSIRKLVFERSKGINFRTFPACSVDFFSGVVFHQICLDFWCHLGVRLAILFRKTVPGTALKEGALNMQTSLYEHVPGLSERPHRVRTSQTRNNSSSSKDVRICCHCIFQQMFESAVCIGFHCKLSNNMIKNVQDQCQEHIADDLTRPWPRLGELRVTSLVVWSMN